MATYEERIAAFAQGKRLLRMPRPIRNRADAFCDACGSTRPTNLCALKDLESGRYYFTGTTCLKELVGKGVIVRRFGKESGQAAYEKEMQIRSEETQSDLDPNEHQEKALGQSPTKAAEEHGQHAAVAGGQPINPTVLVIQYADHYTAFVSINTDGSERSGSAEEPRWEETWRRTGIRGLVLEKVISERAEAATRCITRAWQIAFSSQVYIERPTRPENGSNDAVREESPGLPDSLVNLLELADLTQVGRPQVLTGSNGAVALGAEETAVWKH